MSAFALGRAYSLYISASIYALSHIADTFSRLIIFRERGPELVGWIFKICWFFGGRIPLCGGYGLIYSGSRVDVCVVGVVCSLCLSKEIYRLMAIVFELGGDI